MLTTTLFFPPLRFLCLAHMMKPTTLRASVRTLRTCTVVSLAPTSASPHTGIRRAAQMKTDLFIDKVVIYYEYYYYFQFCGMQNKKNMINRTFWDQDIILKYYKYGNPCATVEVCPQDHKSAVARTTFERRFFSPYC